MPVAARSDNDRIGVAFLHLCLIAICILAELRCTLLITKNISITKTSEQVGSMFQKRIGIFVSAAYYRRTQKNTISTTLISVAWRKRRWANPSEAPANSASKFINRDPCGGEWKDEGGEQRWCLEKQRGYFLVESLPESGLRIKASAGWLSADPPFRK